MRLLILCFLSIFIVSNSCLADKETASSFWFMSLTRMTLSDDYRSFIDLQPRTALNGVGDDTDGDVRQLLMRGALGYQLSENTGLYQGYAVIPTYEPKKVEHRSFQELLISDPWESFKLVHRVRFEQRLLEGSENIALRGRYFIRFTKPIPSLENFSLASNEEVFFNLNDANNGPDTGFDQNRLFLGVNYRVSKSLSFDLGYQHQHVNRRGGKDDVSNQILFFGVLSNFDLRG